MSDDAITVARRLLGQRLVRELGDGTRLSGIIVETEAYLGTIDRGAHTFGGRRTQRNESMYLPGGHAYVYFTYGMHYCMNVVCGKRDEGVAVLIRALQPTEGIPRMFLHRPSVRSERELCRGPARLTQALAIDRRLDATNLQTSSELFIERARSRTLPSSHISVGPRVGLNPHPNSAGVWSQQPLRFCIRGNPYVSRPAPGAFVRAIGRRMES
jgi:DNA-3-methyladenine glycosylase